MALEVNFIVVSLSAVASVTKEEHGSSSAGGSILIDFALDCRSITASICPRRYHKSTGHERPLITPSGHSSKPLEASAIDVATMAGVTMG